MKNLLLISVFMISISVLQAQIHVGFQVGVNDSKTFLHFNEAPNVFVQNWIPIPLPSLSIPVEVELKPHFSIISGFQYIEAGNNLLLKTDMLADTVTNKIQFLKVPIGVKVELDLNLFTLNGLGGCYVSKVIGIRQNGTFSIDESSYRKSNLTRFDVGVWAGFSLERLLANSIKMNLTFKRKIGLRNMDKRGGEGQFMDATETALGLMIPLKKKTKKLKKAQT